jgi:hypothetical protein
MIGERYKSFPPGWDHLKIPVSSRQAALAGLALYSACRPRAIWLQRAAWAWIRLLGPRHLPGRAAMWQPPMEQWLELAEALEKALGPFDAMAGYLRVQTSRPGVALLLLRRGQAVAFVKTRKGPSEALLNEGRSLSAVSAYAPKTFRAPTPLHSGEVAGWHYLAVSPLPAQLHRPPVDPPVGEILQEVRSALAAVPRPPDLSPDWQPMHGDFAPWNLRTTGPRSLYLFDWERAGWGPAGADEVFYRATVAALAERPAHQLQYPEAVRFWRERIAQHSGNVRDLRLGTALAKVLDQMHSPDGHAEMARSTP